MTRVDEQVVAVAERPRKGLALLIAQATLIALYAALVVVPYFVNGLQREKAAYVEGGVFDPKGMWPYGVAVIGEPLTYVVALVSGLGWLLSGLLAAAALILAIGHTTWAARARIGATVGLAVMFVLFQFSAFGHHLARWMAD